MAEGIRVTSVIGVGNPRSRIVILYEDTTANGTTPPRARGQSAFLDDLHTHQIGQMPQALYMVAVEDDAVQQRHGVFRL